MLSSLPPTLLLSIISSDHHAFSTADSLALHHHLVNTHWSGNFLPLPDCTNKRETVQDNWSEPIKHSLSFCFMEDSWLTCFILHTKALVTIILQEIEWWYPMAWKTQQLEWFLAELTLLEQSGRGTNLLIPSISGRPCPSITLATVPKQTYSAAVQSKSAHPHC